MKFKLKLLDYLQKHGTTTIDNLAEALGVTRQYVHRLVSELLAEGLIKKNGTAPHVFYSAVNLMHYAKQGQNKNLMAEIVQAIQNRIAYLIDSQMIDAVLYVPPTIGRKVQIMDYLEKNLQINRPKIQVKKVSNQIIIPQKALSKLFERVANARSTFIIPQQQSYTKILILDDAIGSGATINEIALKVKEKNIAKEIVGLAITGSYKEFEVVSEL